MIVVTLTTDFGTRDPYVAEMKGAILARTREVFLVDVTHEVAAHDVVEGALALEAAAPWFPPGTVHLAVVDPGVGTARAGLVLEAGGHVFVGPDNGLFTPFLVAPGWRAWRLADDSWGVPGAPQPPPTLPSRTFHGRDVFAPAVARLALGTPPASLGTPHPTPVRVPWPEARASQGRLEGVVVHVDRFGNLITSVRAEALAALGQHLAVGVKGRVLALVGTYGDLAQGRPGALVGSGGRLEIAVREGQAARALSAGRGTRVTVTRRSRGRK